MHDSHAQFSKSYMQGSFLPFTATSFLAFVYTADVMSLTVIYYKYLGL